MGTIEEMKMTAQMISDQETNVMMGWFRGLTLQGMSASHLCCEVLLLQRSLSRFLDEFGAQYERHHRIGTC